MNAKIIPPTINAKSFNCPHCNALAHQTWFKTYVKPVDSVFIPDRETFDEVEKAHRHDPEMQETINWFRKACDGVPFAHASERDFSNATLELIYAARCFSCNKFSLWITDKIIYPITKLEIEPNPDLPPHILSDFVEASTIFEASPRGSAALLRLALQKLLQHLEVPGDKIDHQIARLVAEGLPPKVQKALDIVRVVGNSAVHPGQIDVQDNREIALALFSLLNIITDALVTQPRQIDSLFEELPEGVIKGIERRDKPKAIEGPKKN
ncbi:DUF4145 domain-containing protein [Methylobacterium ajmalii]|uniref:DUF4145 domain-containing protein n=1 Tax=Methylobacterium ajmalii TaxID=2738439 RepID=A0ABV0A5Y3_9HYPH